MSTGVSGSQRPLEGVVLARHGETNDNLEPLRFQGFTDTPLNDTGRAQAHSLAERIAAGVPLGRSATAGFCSLWSSDLSRASETARIVGARLGLPATTRRASARGKPRSLGGPHVRRDRARRARALQRPGARRPRSGAFPDGESLLEQQQRVTAALTEIHADGELPALVVCHGGSIRVMLCASDPRGLDAFHDFDIPNVAVVPL